MSKLTFENLAPNISQPYERRECTLSIVIVSWNTRELLRACLRSVSHEIERLSPLPARPAPPPIPHLPEPPSVPPMGGEAGGWGTEGGAEEWAGVETLVIDNASDDGSAEMVREQFPWVTLIENKTNVGFAPANNRAILNAMGRYVLLLNPDTEVKPGAVEALVRFLEANPQAAGAGSQLLNRDGTLQLSCHPMPTLFRELLRMFHLTHIWPNAAYPMGSWDLEEPRRVDVLQGACLLLRREALDEVGLFDERYFFYSEEVELCCRLQHAGWLLYWVPQSQVVHYGGQSSQQVVGEMFLQLYYGKIVFFRQHYGRLATQTYKSILFAAALARLLISPLAWLEEPAQRERHLKLARYYRRLLFALPGM